MEKVTGNKEVHFEINSRLQERKIGYRGGNHTETCRDDNCQ